MQVYTKKATFVLPEVMLAQMKQVVRDGLADSASSLVRDALSRYLHELEELRAFREMEDAAVDPLFLADVQEISEAFAVADAESARLAGE